jgi:hypothetical protein
VTRGQTTEQHTVMFEEVLNLSATMQAHIRHLAGDGETADVEAKHRPRKPLSRPVFV